MRLYFTVLVFVRIVLEESKIKNLAYFRLIYFKILMNVFMSLYKAFILVKPPTLRPSPCKFGNGAAAEAA